MTGFISFLSMQAGANAYNSYMKIDAGVLNVDRDPYPSWARKAVKAGIVSPGWLESFLDSDCCNFDRVSRAGCYVDFTNRFDVPCMEAQKLRWRNYRSHAEKGVLIHSATCYVWELEDLTIP